MRRGYSDKPMVSGKTATPGKYVCLECGYKHRVETGVVNLPVCPRCQGETWQAR